MSLPYRDNVGALLFNALGQVLVARRADMPNAEGAAGGWQLPQGGMDAGEDPAVAIFRELQVVVEEPAPAIEVVILLAAPFGVKIRVEQFLDAHTIGGSEFVGSMLRIAPDLYSSILGEGCRSKKFGRTFA